MGTLETALVERSNGTAELTTASSAADMRRRLQEMREKVSIVQSFFRDVMVQDEDYGIIPGTAKPSLLKPGAEKLCEFYGYAITIKEERKTQNIETGYCEYEVVVALVSRRTGEVIAEGVGAANTMESRYRWRWVWERDLPAGVDKSSLQTRSTRNGGTQYRLENEDPWSLWNTVKKMAKKRALIDATLSATRSSGLFTQDMEDLREWAAQGEVIDGEVSSSNAKQAPPRSAQSRNGRSNGNVSAKPSEAKRQEYLDTALRVLRGEAYGMLSETEFEAFVRHRTGASPEEADIAAIHALALVCQHAANGHQKSRDKLLDTLEEWKSTLGRDASTDEDDFKPDDVPF